MKIARIALSLMACVGLIALLLFHYPSTSRAVQTQSRETKSRGAFVPGEILVRYRNEETAQLKTGRIVVPARGGEQLTADVERFDRAGLVKGLRMARVAPADTLKAITALRRQPDVLYAPPNYLPQPPCPPHDPPFPSSLAAWTSITKTWWAIFGPTRFPVQLPESQATSTATTFTTTTATCSIRRTPRATQLTSAALSVRAVTTASASPASTGT